jgi:hypothetical protein
MPRPPSPLPPDLAQAARRFADWRRCRSGRAIPVELWNLAADLASRHGLSRTSRALHVQYNDLKKHLPAVLTPASSPAEPSFVEILTATAAAPAEISVTIEHPSGPRMRIRLTGADRAVLAELSRTFLGCRP